MCDEWRILLNLVMMTFSTSAIVKTKASPARPCALLKRQMGRVEDYLHPVGMYIGNMQKSADCINNKDRAIAEEPFTLRARI